MSTRLTALIVNYNSGAYAEACAASLVADWLHAGYAREDLELVVVDNASPAPQEEHLVRFSALRTTLWPAPRTWATRVA